MTRSFAGDRYGSLALLTDLYQLTMAYGYWKLRRSEQDAVFHLTFRNNPFAGGYAVAAGLQPVIEFLRAFQFQDDDLEFLAGIEGNDQRPIFDREFLDYLRSLRFTCDIDAVPEGTLVFAHEPLIRVRGPLLQCQLLETPLLNLINYQTLIATKAARVVDAAGDDPVLEFGLRRAQGIDGGIAASRAAYIGGAAATSNVLAGKLFGIPVKGTHAHSWVMSHDTELESFSAYAEALPNNCVFLVDTYNSLQGVRNAIDVGQRLREQGHEMVGIRLDSGDLAYLSIEARRLLDAAGFPDAQIVASNDLDEHVIHSLKQQGARIGVWGVGTRLVTGGEQAALGGVYKLAAIRDAGGPWRHKLKLSEQTIKISNPGIQQVRRYRQPNGLLVADMIFDELTPAATPPTIVDPADPLRHRRLDDSLESELLLQPIFRGGELVYDPPPLAMVRQHRGEQMQLLHPTIRRLHNPHGYPVGLERNFHQLKTKLIMESRGQREE